MYFQVQVNVDLEIAPWMCSITFTIQMSQEIILPTLQFVQTNGVISSELEFEEKFTRVQIFF